MGFSHLFRSMLVIALLLAVAVPSAMAQNGSGRINGRVVDQAGEPIAGVAILAQAQGQRAGGISSEFEGTSDDGGRFSLLGFSSGPWIVSATIDGYGPQQASVDVTQVGFRSVNFVLERILSGLELLVSAEALEGLDVAVLEADLEAADSAFDAEDFDTAIAAYTELLSALPTLTYLHLNIGNAYRGNGDYEMALASYETLSGDPERGEQAKIEIARTRLAMGDLDAAATIATAGADASREDLYNLGEVDFAKGDIDSAAGWYEKAAAVDPDWEKPWFKLALVSLNKGDIESAKQHFQKVVDMAPSSEEGAQAQATLSALP